MSDSEIEKGFLVGAFPTVAMIVATFVLQNIEVSPHIEAALQNFAGGLILAAVAAELFPFMVSSDDVNASYIGISVGFFVGLCTIYGVEHLVEYIESTPEDELFGSRHRHDSVVKTYPKGFEPLRSRAQSEFEEPVSPESLGSSSVEIPELTRFMSEVNEDWEESDVEKSSRAICIPQHRDHVAEHLREILGIIDGIETRSRRLSTEQELVISFQEEIAEQIDESIHILQYKLDHTRRLLQGSETQIEGNLEVSAWVTEGRKENIERNISGLRLTVEHLLEHISEPVLDKDVVREMRIHMDHMDKQISLFHESIETAAAKWHRKLPKIATNEGDTLPMGLVLPVCLDCFVDGFLIGISSIISLKAGIILSFANCLEMSFLGMAYSARLKKCTGSSWFARNFALYGPPFIMFAAAGLGAALGVAVQNIPAIFIAMVAFGAVALIFLVCNELIIEAKQAQGDDEKWYISIQIFVGIYLVLMLDHVL